MNPRLSAEEFRNAISGKPKSKYRNAPIEIDGIRFASKKEAQYFVNLKLMERTGDVYGVELQKRYALIGPDGALITTYVADFVYWDQREKRHRIVDVKGVETDVFKLKRKMMRSFLGLEIEVIK